MKAKNAKHEVEDSPKEPIKLKISRARLEDLAGLLPMWSNGRFMALKTEARREIQETPADQFVIIKAPHMMDNKKERIAASTALCNLINPMGWILRWSNEARGFLLVRKEQYKQIKQGSKKDL